MPKKKAVPKKKPSAKKLLGLRQIEERREWIVFMKYVKGFSFSEISAILSAPISKQGVQKIAVARINQ